MHIKSLNARMQEMRDYRYYNNIVIVCVYLVFTILPLSPTLRCTLMWVKYTLYKVRKATLETILILNS